MSLPKETYTKWSEDIEPRKIFPWWNWRFSATSYMFLRGNTPSTRFYQVIWCMTRLQATCSQTSPFGRLCFVRQPEWPCTHKTVVHTRPNTVFKYFRIFSTLRHSNSTPVRWVTLGHAGVLPKFSSEVLRRGERERFQEFWIRATRHSALSTTRSPLWKNIAQRQVKNRKNHESADITETITERITPRPP